MIEFVVGAGGKTSYIHQRAKEELAQGHRVLVCTSTHMLIEADTLITDKASEIQKRLDDCGYCMAGSRASEEKMGPLGWEVYLAACTLADVVLVEADGSKHHPVKACNETEPVIYKNAKKNHRHHGHAGFGTTVQGRRLPAGTGMPPAGCIRK